MFTSSLFNFYVLCGKFAQMLAVAKIVGTETKQEVIKVIQGYKYFQRKKKELIIATYIL